MSDAPRLRPLGQPRVVTVRTDELEAILGYGQRQVECLMQVLRRALGDDQAPRCERCSLCAPTDHPTPEITDADRAMARPALRPGCHGG